MPRPCTICSHPDRASIDAALSARLPLDEVLSQFGLPSRSALQRHRAQHVGRSITFTLPPATLPVATSPEPAAAHIYNECQPSGVVALFERATSGPERSLQDHARVAFHEVVRLLASAQGPDDRGFALRALRELRGLLQFAALVKIDNLRAMPGWAEPARPRDPIFALEQLLLAQVTGTAEAETEARALLDETFPGFASALAEPIGASQAVR